MTLTEIRTRIAELDRKARSRKFTDAERETWNDLNAQVEEHEREVRTDRLRELAGREENTEGEPSGAPDRPQNSAARSAALATVDRFTRSGELTSAAADRLDAHVRRNDPLGMEARYLSAVGDPAYLTAFGKLLQDPTNGHLRHEPAEVEAMRVVARVEQERAAMAEGATTTGGFAIPLTLDPSILLSSSGVLNPIRAISRVITITTRQWQGVSSDGVVASYDAEAAEVSDDSPTLAGPTITTAMGRVFVPFSMELGDDWATLTQELTRLISDARDVLDSAKFYSGSGTDEPAGVITGLTAAEKINTVGSNVFAYGDLWLLKQAVGNRWKSATTFAAHSDTLDVAYQMVGLADASKALAMEGRAGDLLGRPKVEWNSMTAGSLTPADNDVLMIAGDFNAGYTIADRLGMQVELVPHLFGTNKRPTGQRGIFARWRTGAAVVNRAALRYLNTKP